MLFSLRCSLALLCLLLSFPAQAQDTLSTRKSKPIVVTALKEELEQRLIPFSVSSTPVKPGNGISLSNALGALPGLQIDNRYNFAVGDRISNRGFGARTQFGVRGVKIILDDVPATYADGQSALEIVDPLELSFAEVLRGPGSSLYGNASGGVLLLKSPLITSSPFSAKATTTAGSDGLLRLNTTLQSHIGAAKLEGGFTNFQYDGYRDFSDASIKRGWLRSSIALGPTDQLNVNGAYLSFNAHNPGALTEVQVKDNPLQASVSSLSNQAGKSGDQSQLSATLYHTFGSDLLKVSAYGITRNIANPIVGRIIDLDRLAGGLSALYDIDFRKSSEENSASADILPFKLTSGIELNTQLDDRKNYSNKSGIRDALTLDQTEGVTNIGAYTQLTIPILAHLLGMGSLRYDHTNFNVKDHMTDSIDESGSRVMNGLSPALGVLWAPLEEFSLFANISTSFETPTTTELANRPNGAGGFNPDLKPQHALGFEAGLRHQLISDLSYDLTAYRIAIQDELIPFEIESSPGRSYYRNAGSAIHQGAEASLLFTPLSSLQLRAGITYIDARFDSYQVDTNNYSGNRIPGVSPFQTQADLIYSTPIGIVLTASYLYRDQQFADDANKVSSAAYSIVDLTAKYDYTIEGTQWEYPVSLVAGVTNLFNTTYNTAVTVNAFGGRYFEPGSPRAFFITLSLRIMHK